MYSNYGPLLWPEWERNDLSDEICWSHCLCCGFCFCFLTLTCCCLVVLFCRVLLVFATAKCCLMICNTNCIVFCHDLALYKIVNMKTYLFFKVFIYFVFVYFYFFIFYLWFKWFAWILQLLQVWFQRNERKDLVYWTF